ncbi:MAG: hypothetical protein IPF39_16310 [Comamonadaceae bacterium]|uniref:hypothetical protein n=1 Tax=Candidatus Skiveiella danica TaxID=3386177 RepID=UPI0039090853|nr:hypothetical protein [Comamonadaceae bacterium]
MPPSTNCIAVAHLVIVGFVVASDHGQVGVVGIALSARPSNQAGAAQATAGVLDDHRIETTGTAMDAVTALASEAVWSEHSRSSILAEGEALARRRVGRVDEDQPGAFLRIGSLKVASPNRFSL